jgi:hypothetical protein
MGGCGGLAGVKYTIYGRAAGVYTGRLSQAKGSNWSTIAQSNPQDDLALAIRATAHADAILNLQTMAGSLPGPGAVRPASQ